MTKSIPLTKGKFALVDDVDFDRINAWKWCFLSSGYAVRRDVITNKFILMHRQIVNPASNEVVDHIDGDKLNNTRANLRVCNQTRNMQNSNRYHNNTSGYKGVSWSKQFRKWSADIQHNRKHVFLGYFDNVIDAARAYNTAAMKYFGNFARINEIKEG